MGTEVRPWTRRRALSAAAAALLVARSAGIAAQGRSAPRRIGYLFSFIRAEGEHLWEACRQGLRELGYIEGRDIVLEPRWTDGRYERLPDLVAELVRLKVDVLVVAATPGALAAKAAAGQIPIVIVAVSDPVRIGLVKSFARPGGTITGLSLLTPEMSGRRLQMIREFVPQAHRVGVLLNPANRSHDVFLEETQAAAARLAVHVVALKARLREEIEQAVSSGRQSGIDAMIVFDDPVIWSHRVALVATVEKLRLPAIYGYSEFVSEGGLVSYGPLRPDLYRRTASYVDKILKGARPADLPIERPLRFELVVNRKSARALGLEVPQSVLISADRVID